MIICEAYVEHKDIVEPQWKQRDFVSTIKSYINNSLHKIMIVSGLRGTGKTTGVLQACDCESAIYYRAQLLNKDYDTQYTASEIIEQLINDKHKIVILDEFTWFQDYSVIAKALPTLAENGKKIILTGTESLSLELLRSSSLIHRSQLVHTNYFSYDEYLRLNNLYDRKESTYEYLTLGGIFPKYAINNGFTMNEYIKDSIIDGIMKYFPKNNQDDIRAVIYTVFYDAVRRNDLPNVPLYKNAISSKELLEEFGIDADVKITKDLFDKVSDVLLQIGVIIRVGNYKSNEEYRTYIVNPAITSQMIKCIYRIDNLDDRLYGHIFEAMTVVKLREHYTDDVKIYYSENRREGKNFEIDILMIDRDQRIVLVDAKFGGSEKSNYINENSSLVSDVAERFCLMTPDSEIVGRYVIYNGNNSYDVQNNKEIVYLHSTAKIDLWDFDAAKSFVGTLEIDDDER